MPVDQLQAEKKSEEPCTGFLPFFRKKFPGLFQDLD